MSLLPDRGPYYGTIHEMLNAVNATQEALAKPAPDTLDTLRRYERRLQAAERLAEVVREWATMADGPGVMAAGGYVPCSIHVNGFRRAKEALAAYEEAYK